MLRVFSGSCMSLDDIDYLRPRIIEQPHILGPGSDFFDQFGNPVRPQPSAHTIRKVFSGSALDLNEIGDDEDKDDLREPSPLDTGATIPNILEHITSETEREKDRLQKSNTNVLVIGAGGYVASHVVAKLLDYGYSVRCTLNDPLDQRLVMELYALVPEANRRLTIREADLTVPSSFKEIIRGCKFVIHCGVSPSSSAAKNYDIVSAHVQAVKAMFDAVRTYGKGSVRRIILTGSAAAVCHQTDKLPLNCTGFAETHWNEVATAASDPVQFARISFEREAWRLHTMMGVELTVILPTIMIGPCRTNEASEAMRLLCDIANGSPHFPFAPCMYWNFVDVRDVAEAHIRAMELPEAKNQRYIISNCCLSLSEIGKIIRRHHPHLTPPTWNAPTWLTLLIAPLSNSRVSMRYIWNTLGKKVSYDTTKAKNDLKLTTTSIEHTVRDAVEELITAGHLPSKDAPAKRNVIHYCAAFVTTALAVSLTIRYFRRRYL